MAQHQPASFGYRLQREGRGVGDQREVAGQTVQAGAQVRAGQHGEANHVEVDVAQCQLTVQSKGGVAGPRHSQFPQTRHLVRGKTRIRRLQQADVGAGGLEQLGHVHAL